MLTTHFVPGAPNWIDLGSPDPQVTADFYRRLLGWQLDTTGPDPGNYNLFRLGGRVAGGVAPLTLEHASKSWMVYFHTPDADLTTKAVEQAGGTVRLLPRNVFTEGRMAGFTDPTGAEFAVWQPNEVQGLGVVGDPGSLCWTELRTPSPATVRVFYATVLGWTARDRPFPGGTYTFLVPTEGGERADLGGIVPESEGTASHWLPYFKVTDCDTAVTKAQELGGRVVTPPTTTAGVGRMAQLADPFGARFAVTTGEPG